ncbi:hypothetical protein HUN08_07065 [Gordonia sp. X0973]|uniref:hypothetical protein n=1 Tax=Gordonia sp. X0973 TaxID=2742602 RepID=UPI000F5370B4|nr:hypothetical protein [Gordonia sp. X0973]QKT06979.1 hypothetical protein HUN08_07065 [Gordonia sp. X0973]
MNDAEKAIQDFLDKLEEISHKIPDIGVVFTVAANSFLARFILNNSDAIISAGKWALETAQKLLDKILEYLRGCWAPVYFIKASHGWGHIQISANNLNAGITSPKLALGSWQGSAADNYRGATGKQAPAAARVASMSGSLRTALSSAGGAGIAFYIGVTAATISFLVELGAELGAAETVIGAIPAAAAAVASSVKGIIILLGLAAAITNMINTQSSNISSLNVEGDSANGFEDGKWPKATTSGDFSDATVLDGDADWSVKPA